MSREYFGDVQTTILSGVFGSMAGISSQVASAKLVNVLRGVQYKGESGLVHALVQLILRSGVSSAAYLVTARLAPETASNTFFAFSFFTADQQLTQYSQAVGMGIMHTILSTLGINPQV